MEINLRKANAVQAEIRRAINAVAMDDTVTVTEYTQNVSDVIDTARKNYAAAVDRKLALTNALFNIRNSVANANATAGINTILTQVERIDQLINVVNALANQKASAPLEETLARLEKLKKAPTDPNRVLYGDRYNNVEVSVATADSIAAAKAEVKELRRQRQALQDKLLTLNVTAAITIGSDELAVLKDEGIL
jgi:uncharacterized protein YdcH (DUF465 family)